MSHMIGRVADLVHPGLIILELTLHIVESRLGIVQLNLPVLCALVILTEGLGGVLERGTQGLDLILLCVYLLVEHLVSGRERTNRIVVFLKL